MREQSKAALNIQTPSWLLTHFIRLHISSSQSHVPPSPANSLLSHLTAWSLHWVCLVLLCHVFVFLVNAPCYVFVWVIPWGMLRCFCHIVVRGHFFCLCLFFLTFIKECKLLLHILRPVLTVCVPWLSNPLLIFIFPFLSLCGKVFV